VRALLKADEAAGEFLEKPAVLVPETVAQGTRLGPYEVVRELGHGGMGTVFLARRADDAFHKQVAVKVVRRGLDSEHVLERFEAERRILATLEHPSIARIIDAGSTSDGRPWFAMDFIEGRSLTEHCRATSPSVRARVELMREVCGVVQYAHSRLVVHRDLKPSNILVSADGAPHLLDFGLAKVLRDDGDDGARTATQQRWLTPDYASPEQVRGERVTTASDVHGLGLLLHEVLTGTHPLRRDSADDTLKAIVDTQPAPPSASLRASGAPNLADLDAIVLKALRKEPEGRYATAEALADDLGRWLEGLPVRAAKGSTRYQLARFLRRNRGAVLAVSAVFVSLISGLVATLWEARIARQQTALAQRRYAELRQLASTALFEIHDAVREVPGNTVASALIVKRSTEYLDRLAADAGDDPELLRELARAWSRLGLSLSASSGGGVVGDSAGARQSLERALELQQKLIAKAGVDDDWRELAKIEMRLSDVLLTLGKSDEALVQARNSVAAALKDPSPERPTRTQLAGSYQTLAFVLEAREAHGEALEAVRAGRAVLQELSVRIPGDADLESSIIASLRQEGAVLTASDQLDSARTVLEAAVDAGTKLAEAHPTRVFRRNLSLAENSLGNVLHELKDYAAALVHYERSLALRSALLAEDPRDADAGWLVLAANYERAECLEHLERFDEGLADADAVNAAAVQLAAKDPNDTVLATKLASYEALVADLFADRAEKEKRPDDLVSARRWIALAHQRLEALAGAGKLSDRSTLDEVADRRKELEAKP